ncbi:polysaccharide biosynthesis tyrosine autokinase [Armatimonas sp.]|uniref:polysaccharide biosynthesis tyrosine autokinase n=1 Tax=Armatimonas sp. TaxID=1872638 RepID=UPI00375174D8
MQERTDLSAEGSPSISLSEYGGILRRRRAIILQTFVIVLVAGVLITLFQPLVYQASARVLLEPPSYLIQTVNNDPLAELFKLNSPYSPPTQVELLKSSAIKKRAGELMTNGKSLTNYSVVPVEGGTSIVEVIAEGDDPNAVTETANHILKAYIDDVNDKGSKKLDLVYAEAEKNLNKHLATKNKAQRDLLNYQKVHKISDLEIQAAANQKQLGELSQTYQKQLSEINYLTTRIGEIVGYMSRQKKERLRPGLLGIEQDPNWESIQRTIADKEAIMAAAKEELGDDNDRLRALRAEFSRLTQYATAYKKGFEKKNLVLDPTYEGFDVELKKLRIDLASAENASRPNFTAIQELRNRLGQTPDFSDKIAELKQIQTNAAGRIDYFNTKMQDIELRKNAKVETSRVIEDAIVPGSPVRPNKPQNIMFAGLLGVFLGLCLALLQELLDDRINSPEEAERVLRLPNLGHVPLVEEEGLRLIRDISTFSPLMESYRSLRTNINFAAVGTTLRSIVVTSSVPAEGKSTTAANLAMAMALDGKRVIIVDADLRRPSLHKLFRQESSPGLTDILVGTHEISEVIRSCGVENVSVIAAGSPPPNPAELLGSARMVELIAQLESLADIVLFDSPPTLAVADSVVLAARTNGVLLVIGYGETKKTNSRQAVERLQRANARVLGTVLNRVEGTSSGYYYGKYYVPASVESSRTGRGVAEPTARGIEASSETSENEPLGKGRD